MSANVKPRVLVIMGVSGSGKTSVAEGLHEALGWPFQEGDKLHSEENVAKMTAGIPLTDEDRWPWLDDCAKWIHARTGEGGLLTCSALKRVYRERLAKGNPAARFLYLKVSEEIVRERLAQRRGHYMPPSLLPSQLRTLEEPGSDEPVLTLPAGLSVEETVAHVLEMLKQLDESGA